MRYRRDCIASRLDSDLARIGSLLKAVILAARTIINQNRSETGLKGETF